MAMPTEIMEEHVDLLKKNIDNDRFYNCWQISADYTRFYVIANDVDATFFGELCQSVFSEIQVLLGRYDFPDERRKEVREQLKVKLDSVVRAAKSANDAGKYLALRDLRVYMTRLQFDVWYTEAPRVERRPTVFRS
jgi:hypothetical protein